MAKKFNGNGKSKLTETKIIVRMPDALLSRFQACLVRQAEITGNESGGMSGAIRGWIADYIKRTESLVASVEAKPARKAKRS